MNGRDAPRSLRIVRSALTRSLGWHAHRAPRLEVRDLVIEGPTHALAARLYTPAESSARPPILYFHGGGFVMSGLATHEALCRWLAAAAGMRLLSVSYRLAPEHPFPAQLEDARMAADWALANAQELGTSSAHLVIGGDSAGGYLAARTALDLAAEHPGSVIAQVLLSPLIQVGDREWAVETLRSFRWVGRAAVAYIRHSLGRADFASLLDLPLAETPPSVIVCGGSLDPVRADVAAYADALVAAGVSVAARHYPALVHGGLNLTRLSPLAVRALAEAGALLRRIVDDHGAPVHGACSDSFAEV